MSMKTWSTNLLLLLVLLSRYAMTDASFATTTLGGSSRNKSTTKRALVMTLQAENPTFEFQPSRVVMNQVTQSYPQTIFRTLFSSVPKREFALYNVSLTVQGETIVLLGASSSGKSTLMKLIAQQEKPSCGQVHVSCKDTTIRVVAEPIFLDQNPPFDDSKTVRTLLEKIIKNKRLNDNGMVVGQSILDALCSSIGLTQTELDKKPSQLSPSENYKYGLTHASLESSLSALSSQEQNLLENSDEIVVPAPVLLLDEWVDLEPSTIVHRVEESMIRLTKQCGAVIIYATHKPQLLATSHRTVTLCRGEILSEGTGLAR